MSDSEEIITNSAGGKQSKLYTAYHLIDPWALHSLAAILHRGAIKYDVDNWRKIGVEEHINHAMHHLVTSMKRYTSYRIGVATDAEREDQLAHALCRVMFALSKEIERNGIHPEHSDPTYHEVKTPSAEPGTLRVYGGGVRSILSTAKLLKGERTLAALGRARRRNYTKRTPKVPGTRRSRI